MVNLILSIGGIVSVMIAAIVIVTYSPNFKKTADRLCALAFASIALILAIGSVI